MIGRFIKHTNSYHLFNYVFKYMYELLYFLKSKVMSVLENYYKFQWFDLPKSFVKHHSCYLSIQSMINY